MTAETTCRRTLTIHDYVDQNNFHSLRCGKRLKIRLTVSPKVICHHDHYFHITVVIIIIINVIYSRHTSEQVLPLTSSPCHFFTPNGGWPRGKNIHKKPSSLCILFSISCTHLVFFCACVCVCVSFTWKGNSPRLKTCLDTLLLKKFKSWDGGTTEWSNVPKCSGQRDEEVKRLLNSYIIKMSRRVKGQ